MAGTTFSAGEILTAANLNAVIDEAGGFQNADNVTLADDEAARIDFDGAARGVALVVPNLESGGGALIMFRAGSASAYVNVLASVVGGPTVTGTTGALTGITGTDGELTISARTTQNRLDIENRTGGARTYSFSFLAMVSELTDGTWTIIP